MDISLPHTAIIVVSVIIGHAAYWLFDLLILKPFFDPLQHLPGPKGPLFESHLRQVMDPELSSETYKDWRTRFGKTFRFHGFGKHDYRLMSFDFRVISHVMATAKYEKPWQTRSFLGRLIGRGIFSMEGDAHKTQRRIIAPAFNYQSIIQMAPVFFKKADELAERWKDIVAEKMAPVQAPVPSVGTATIDVAHWISRASFDIIGLAGFNYDFHSLKDESEKVYSAYRRMFNIADKGLGMKQIVELYFPFIRKLWVDDDIRTTNECLQVIAESGKAIVAERKLALQTGQANPSKDLLSLLIESNLTESSKLTDKELLDQCSTFLLAGSDSVSVALASCLHLLSLNPGVQNRLRKDINAIRTAHDDEGSDSSMDSGFQDCTAKSRWESIGSLRYLDYVVRETLRLCPPVHATIRVATEDDMIPISHPITTSGGTTIRKGSEGYVKIRKGTFIHIPLEGFNHSEDVWGKDALEFNPDRWAGVQDWDPAKPGIHNMMTFGYGPASCLGHRFSLMEMKVFIATLLPQFEFRPAEDIKIAKFNSIVTRPFVSGKWDEGTQLPITICEIK